MSGLMSLMGLPGGLWGRSLMKKAGSRLLLPLVLRWGVRLGKKRYICLAPGVVAVDNDPLDPSDGDVYVEDYLSSHRDEKFRGGRAT